MNKITITHLYPDKLNIYGDIGNIIVLKNRANSRNVAVEINNYTIGEMFPSDTNIYFIGGGEDKEQQEVAEDLRNISTQLSQEVGNRAVVLAICGGYQLLGKHFLTGDRKMIYGAGILDIETKAPNSQVKERCIGNVVVELAAQTGTKVTLKTLVGFENHSGQTFLGKTATPLGYVKSGNGNNLKDKTEGVRYKNIFGTYLHGSLLPKNPHFADYLIELALQHRYKKEISLSKLDDTDELEAHKFILSMYGGR